MPRTVRRPLDPASIQLTAAQRAVLSKLALQGAPVSLTRTTIRHAGLPEILMGRRWFFDPTSGRLTVRRQAEKAVTGGGFHIKAQRRKAVYDSLIAAGRTAEATLLQHGPRADVERKLRAAIRFERETLRAIRGQAFATDQARLDQARTEALKRAGVSRGTYDRWAALTIGPKGERYIDRLATDAPQRWLYSRSPEGPFELRELHLSPVGRSVLRALHNAYTRPDAAQALRRFEGIAVPDVDGAVWYLCTDETQLAATEQRLRREGKDPYKTGSAEAGDYAAA